MATLTPPADEFAGREQLRASSVEFRREVIAVADGVFAAVGYSASNVTLIQGDNGSIIVDTAANPVDAQAIVDAFGDRLRRPVRAMAVWHGTWICPAERTPEQSLDSDLMPGT